MLKNIKGKSKSILFELISPIIIAFIIATIIFTLIINENQRNARDMLASLRHEMITLVHRDLNTQLNKAIQLNRINANAFRSGILNVDDQRNRERYFTSLIREFDDVAMTYIGLVGGEFYGARRNVDGSINIVKNNNETLGHSEYYSIDENGNQVEKIEVFENFDPRMRPWYAAATEKKDLAFSGIYSHFVFNEPTLTASIPIYENSQLIGVLGVDYLLTGINKTLEQLPLGDNGQVFIIDRNGLMIASSTGESIFKIVDGKSQNKLATESTNPLIQATLLLPPTIWESTLPEMKVNEQNYMLGKDKFEFNEITWDIYTVILESDFFANNDMTVYRTFFGGILIFIIFIFLILFIVRHIIRPIMKLNVSADKLSHGISVEIPLGKRNNEIYKLTESFNDMSKKIVNHVDELANQVKLRTKELEEKNLELSLLSYEDELMAISNRRHFDEFFDQALELASRNNTQIGLMMLDIDNFKEYNDAYGHIEGDECLRKIGKALKRCVHRKSDMVARYGGEEMVVVLQDATKEHLLYMAETIRLEVFNMKLPNERTKLGIVTVSIGAVLCEVKPKQTAEEVLLVADKALYEAKANGKNRTVIEEMI